jgi:transcription initiation factor TFIIIB Brf1 subunit/transcription initiation factor TFIIB
MDDRQAESRPLPRVECLGNNTNPRYKKVLRQDSLTYLSSPDRLNTIHIISNTKIPMVDPTKCIAKVANKLRISQKTKYQAINIKEEVVNKKINAGKDPNSIAATVLYVSSLNNDEKIPQKDIAAAAGITEVTIRNRLKDLKNHLK